MSFLEATSFLIKQVSCQMLKMKNFKDENDDPDQKYQYQYLVLKKLPNLIWSQTKNLANNETSGSNKNGISIVILC